MQWHSLTGVFVDQVERSELAATFGVVAHEIPSPDMVLTHVPGLLRRILHIRSKHIHSGEFGTRTGG